VRNAAGLASPLASSWPVSGQAKVALTSEQRTQLLPPRVKRPLLWRPTPHPAPFARWRLPPLLGRARRWWHRAQGNGRFGKRDGFRGRGRQLFGLGRRGITGQLSALPTVNTGKGLFGGTTLLAAGAKRQPFVARIRAELLGPGPRTRRRRRRCPGPPFFAGAPAATRWRGLRKKPRTIDQRKNGRCLPRQHGAINPRPRCRLLEKVGKCKRCKV